MRCRSRRLVCIPPPNVRAADCMLEVDLHGGTSHDSLDEDTDWQMSCASCHRRNGALGRCSVSDSSRVAQRTSTLRLPCSPLSSDVAVMWNRDSYLGLPLRLGDSDTVGQAALRQPRVSLRSAVLFEPKPAVQPLGVLLGLENCELEPSVPGLVQWCQRQGRGEAAPSVLRDGHDVV